MAAPPLRLGVNVDHVATLRNARAGRDPDPVRAALTAIEAGADGITAHLREDRRHIRDDDMARLKAELSKPLNFEMAATEDMLAIALATRPHAVCLVPERREELTTEGGLDVVGQHNTLKPLIARLNEAGVRVSLFIDATAFWTSLVDLSRDRKSPRTRLLFVPAMASLILGFATAFGSPHSFPAPPLWLAAVLAVTGAAVWWRSKPFELISQRVPAAISR